MSSTETARACQNGVLLMAMVLLACHNSTASRGGSDGGLASGGGGSAEKPGTGGAVGSGGLGAPDGAVTWDGASKNDTDPSRGDGLSGSASWSTACKAYVKAYCAVVNSCYPAALEHFFGTLDNCASRYAGSDCEAQGNAPGSTLAPTDLLACAQATAAESCLDYRWRALPECNSRGSLADNSPCTYGHQCQSSFCALASRSWCGTCKLRGKVGDPCAGWLRSCEDGLECGDPGESGTWACVSPVAQGGACNTDFACNPGFLCINGTCARAKQVGEACNARDCDSEHDALCTGTTDGGGRICEQASYGAAGDSCDLGGARHCGNSGVCNANDSGVGGTCVAALADEAPCDQSTACLYPALCLNGKCTRASTIAGSCK